MRLACWNWGGRLQAGTVSADGLEVEPLHVADASSGTLALIDALVAGDGLPPAAGARLPLAAVTLAAPLPRPRRNLFCVGRNYHAHAAELAATVFRESLPREHAWPIVFSKLPETVVGPFDDVQLPPAAVSAQIDYESELAVVIGRPGRDIPGSRAHEHVFGYTVVNDVTARDLQVRHQQWLLGKSLDGFCPMGPWIVSADELDGRNLRVRGWVTPAGSADPELRQDGNTRDLIFDIPTLIASR
jgi:2-keto-4-pentenoate hydratase/2-oxohepta-3-ene-1,7-dioic acid hydratase in catechol pathway